MRNITGIKVQVGEINLIKKETVQISDYTDWYPFLDCDTFDIVVRNIGGRPYNIICDDEGLFRSSNFPAFLTLDEDGDICEIIYGTLFITNNEGEDLTSLTDEDVQHILNHIATIRKADHESIQIVVIGAFE